MKTALLAVAVCLLALPPAASSAVFQHAARQFEPAPYEEYQGAKAKAAWHFDQKMAHATAAYHAGGFGNQDQFIKWNDPYWVDAGTRFFFTTLTWVGDGQTVKVHPAYAESYPSQPGGRGPRWLDAGKPAGHSTAPLGAPK